MGDGRTTAYITAFTATVIIGCGRSPTEPQNVNPSYVGVPSSRQYSNRNFLPTVYRHMQNGSIADAQHSMDMMKGYAAGNPDAREQFRAADAEMAGRPVPAYGMSTSVNDDYGIPSLLKPRARLAKAGVQQSSEGLPLNSVSDTYTKKPIMTVLAVINEDGTADHYWTNPLIVANGTRELMAAKRAIFKPYPRIQVDGGPFYDIDTAYPVDEMQLIPIRKSPLGEDLMQTMRDAISGTKRFEPPINVFPYDNPPSPTTPDSVALGVMGWQEMTDIASREMGIKNPFSIRIVRQRTLPVVNIIYEGKRRSDGSRIPIGQFAVAETKRDANGVPVEAFVYINPTVRVPLIVGAHEVGHSLGIYGGDGLPPYNAGHLPNRNANIMHEAPVVRKPSPFEGLIVVTLYSLKNGIFIPAIYADKDIQVKIPGTSPDFNDDGESNFDDFFLFANGFGTSNTKFDLNNDGIAGFDDFFIFADAFGKKREELGKYTTSEQERQRLLDEQRSQHPAINRSVRR